MAILTGYPIVSQLTTIRPNPDPDPNGPMDCVEAATGSAILWYQGKKQWDETINPDLLKNASYGEYYTGGTSAARLTAIFQKLGYKLSPIENANYALAVQKAHELIRSGLPVVFTQQDDYSKNPDYTHCCTFFAEGMGNLTALDTYIAQPLQFTDAQWTSRLRSTELWTISPINSMELSMLNLSDPIGKYFVQKPGNVWHCVSTNADIHDAHLDFYRKYEGVFGLPLTGEIYLEQLRGTAIMIYERAIAIYDPKRVAGNEAQPGSGAVYLLHIDSGTGQQIIAKPLLLALQDQISKLQAELATKGDVAPLQARINALEAAIKIADAAIHPVAA